MTPRVRRATRRTITVAAVLGIGLLVLQAVLQAIGAFDLRKEIPILIGVVLLAGTLTLQRLATRDKEAEELEAASLFWTPPLLEELHADDLGVYPLSPLFPQDAELYVERGEIDEGLSEALETSPFVLVFGAPRSGKSRTAFEAACASEALRGARVLVPRDADGLRTLLRRRPRVDSARALLWLDGLERFAGALDAERLDDLLTTHWRDPRPGRLYAGPAVTIIATIREQTWDRLLQSDGQEGEFAKAVAGRARAFQLTGDLRDEEAEDAHRKYPGAELAEGIGPALAATGKEEEPPRRPLPVSPELGWGERSRAALQGLWGDKLLLAPAAICGIALLGIAVSAAVHGGIKQPRQPTLGEQAAEIRDSLTKNGRASEKPERVDFHGSGQESYVFSFRDAQRSAGETARADEIRIYDVVGGDRLEERFRFEPDEPAVYQFRGIEDVDGDGEEELIGGYGPTVHSGELLVPFAIDWNKGSGTYQMVSLHRSPPRLGTRNRSKQVSAPYRRTATYRDGPDRISLSGYPAQDIALTQGAPKLLSGYFVRPATAGRTATLEVQVETFDTQTIGPSLRACNFPGSKPIVAHEDRSEAMWQTLLDRWDSVRKGGRNCVTQTGL